MTQTQTTTNGPNIPPPEPPIRPFPFTGFQPLDGGQSVDLSPSKNGGEATLVLQATDHGSDEVLCIWTDGVTFAPATGSYWIFWFDTLAPWTKPSVAEIEAFLVRKGEAGPPGPIHLHPPPTPASNDA